MFLFERLTLRISTIKTVLCFSGRLEYETGTKHEVLCLSQGRTKYQIRMMMVRMVARRLSHDSFLIMGNF